MEIFPARILLAADRCRGGLPAIPVAVEMVKATGSELHIACSVRTRPAMPYPHPCTGRSEALLDGRRIEGLRLLDEMVARAESQGTPVAGSYYSEGRPEREVVRLAEGLGVGLIVTAGHDFGRVGRALVDLFPQFFGSFSERVFHRARCPVLVVRRGEARRYSSAPE